MERLLFEADRGMQQRGWTRVIGFSGAEERVLAYGPGERGADGSIELCLAVLRDRELVVVSASLDTDALADFVQQHLPEELSRTLHRKRAARHGAGNQ